MFQPLESRRLLTSEPVHFFRDEILSVFGTDGPDVIEVTAATPHRAGNEYAGLLELRVNGNVEVRLSVNQVKRLRIEAGGGNDVIFGNPKANQLEGGAGDDVMLSADTRDGSLTGYSPGDTAPRGDLVLGGLGRDFARSDHRDALSNIEREDELPFLWS